MSSTPTVDQRNGALRTPAHASSAHSVVGGTPGGGELDHDPTLGDEQLAGPVQQGDRVAADADVAVGEQGGLPAPLARQPVEDVAAQRGHAARHGSGRPASRRRRCRARRGPAGQRRGQPARAAADVEGVARAVREQLEVRLVGLPAPLVDRQLPVRRRASTTVHGRPAAPR